MTDNIKCGDLHHEEDVSCYSSSHCNILDCCSKFKCIPKYYAITIYTFLGARARYVFGVHTPVAAKCLLAYNIIMFVAVW